MKTLYLLRHAQAEPLPSSFSDFDRPLDEKGREQADQIAAHMKTKELTFDFIMCSAALRTQETLEPLRPIIGAKDMEISESFYNISEDKILSTLQNLPDQIGSVLYIGHNPGIAFAIMRFAHTFPAFLKEGIHPGTLAGFRFPIEKWEDVRWGVGEITDVFQPSLGPIEFPALKEP